MKYDTGKLDWTLIDFTALEGTVRALMQGEIIYGRDNWKTLENAEQRYKAALMRHVVAYMKAPDVKDESGESHLSHIICNALFLLHFEEEKQNDKNTDK